MTQEDKQLLLTDLCARLPYGVIIDSEEYNNAHYRWRFHQRMTAILTLANKIACVDVDDYPDAKHHEWKIDMCKPYLRPMSSMTEEERTKMGRAIQKDRIEPYGEIKNSGEDSLLLCTIRQSTNLQNWLNSHHFDYRGLIEKGMALEAPKGMYQ